MQLVNFMLIEVTWLQKGIQLKKEMEPRKLATLRKLIGKTNS